MGSGDRFIAEVDWVAWRRPLVPWMVGGGIVAAVITAALIAGLVRTDGGFALLALALATPTVKLCGYIARHRRRESPLTVDQTGILVPTAQGPTFLPWETLRQVMVDGPTLRFRLRAGVTPGTPGVTGLHKRDAWPIASGPGLPLDTRLFTRDRDAILHAIDGYSGGRVWSPRS
jgi:hypothetical protein